MQEMRKVKSSSTRTTVLQSKERAKGREQGSEGSALLQSVVGVSEHEETNKFSLLAESSQNENFEGEEEKVNHNFENLALSDQEILTEKSAEPEKLRVRLLEPKSNTGNIKRLTEEKICPNLLKTKIEAKRLKGLKNKTQITTKSQNTSYMIFFVQLLLESSTNPELREYLENHPQLLENTSESIFNFKEQIKKALKFEVEIDPSLGLMVDQDLGKAFYTGQHSWDFVPDGFGALAYSFMGHSWIYVGPFRDGKRHGMGIHKRVSGEDSKVSEWKDDKLVPKFTFDLDFGSF